MYILILEEKCNIIFISRRLKNDKEILFLNIEFFFFVFTFQTIIIRRLCTLQNSSNQKFNQNILQDNKNDNS